jgi:polysaccharide export outer membrane protein
MNGSIASGRPQSTSGPRFLLPAACATVLSLALIACSSEPMKGAAAPEPPVTAAPPARQAAKAGPSEYIIGAGDTLSVVVAQNPDLSAENVPVRPDGRVSTPLANDVVAVGSTPTQLARDIESRLRDYVRAPNVTVIVRTAVGDLGQVKVIGNGVTAPKAFPYHSGMRVLDLVVAAGGLSQFAAGNRAMVVRTNPDGTTHQIKVRLADLLGHGNVAENILLQPGDILVVPESWF